MAIASGRVQIEKIHELEFAQPDFQPSCGLFAEDGKRIALRERASWLNGIAKCSIVRLTYGFEPSEGL